MSSELTAALADLLGAELRTCDVPELKMRLALAHWDDESCAFDAQKIDDIWQHMPYWAFVWSSGHALAQFILQNPHYVKNRRVLDFGAGSGVVAIAAAMSGARSVIACDIDPLALRACEWNAALNGVHLNTATSLADVSADDVILAGDVLYDTRNRDLAGQLFASGCTLLWAESEAHSHLSSQYRPQAAIQGRTLPNPGDFDSPHVSYIYLFTPH
ncbi:MAG: methyltransferase [Oceanospirillaceae bacterium]|nr:methyltransferase [Oceanospirillaceae bacterium]MCP5350029.1 methyltransferase [Oceanospirillaceae bacterium]